eukprot:1443675-Rhodomonas_salina.3
MALSHTHTSPSHTPSLVLTWRRLLPAYAAPGTDIAYAGTTHTLLRPHPQSPVVHHYRWPAHATPMSTRDGRTIIRYPPLSPLAPPKLQVSFAPTPKSMTSAPLCFGRVCTRHALRARVRDDLGVCLKGVYLNGGLLIWEFADMGVWGCQAVRERVQKEGKREWGVLAAGRDGGREERERRFKPRLGRRWEEEGEKRREEEREGEAGKGEGERRRRGRGERGEEGARERRRGEAEAEAEAEGEKTETASSDDGAPMAVEVSHTISAYAAATPCPVLT